MVKRIGLRTDPWGYTIFQQMIGRLLAVYMHTLCPATEITPEPGQSSPSYTYLFLQYAQQKVMINGVECC